MEIPDGWMFVCKLCGKNHEVPKQIAPYYEGEALKRIMVGEIELGCPETPDQTRKYTFTDFKSYRLSV